MLRHVVCIVIVFCLNAVSLPSFAQDIEIPELPDIEVPTSAEDDFDPELPSLDPPIETPQPSPSAVESDTSITDILQEINEEGVIPTLFGDDDADDSQKAQQNIQLPPTPNEAAPVKTLDSAVVSKNGKAIKYRALRKNNIPIPVKRPDVNYVRQILAPTISKKQYERVNSHLPPSRYREEQIQILFDSVALGDLGVMHAMLDKFNSLEVVDAEGNTPLIYAVMIGNTRSVASLLGKGANPNARNNLGISPLYLAIQTGRPDLVNMLLEKGALYAARIDPNLVDINGKTALMLSVERDFADMAASLISQGAELETKMKNGDTALHVAVKNNALNSANLLITKGADIEARNFYSETPVMLAASLGNSQMAALLLAAGADVNKRNARGQNVSQIAASRGFANVVALIETENLQRRSIAQQLITRHRQEAAIDSIMPTRVMVDGVPVPVFKPYQPTVVARSGVPIPVFKPNLMAPPSHALPLSTAPVSAPPAAHPYNIPKQQYGAPTSITAPSRQHTIPPLPKHQPNAQPYSASQPLSNNPPESEYTLPKRSYIIDNTTTQKPDLSKPAAPTENGSPVSSSNYPPRFMKQNGVTYVPLPPQGNSSQ